METMERDQIGVAVVEGRRWRRRGLGKSSREPSWKASDTTAAAAATVEPLENSRAIGMSVAHLLYSSAVHGGELARQPISD